MGNDTSISAPLTKNGNSDPDREFIAGLFRLGIFSVLYIVSIGASLFLGGTGDVAPFWFPSGIFLSLLLIAKRESWGVAVPLFLLLNLLCRLFVGEKLLLGALFAVSDGVEAVLGARLLLRYLGGAFYLDSLRGVFGFVVLWALVATAAGALIFTGASCYFGGGADFMGLWQGVWAARAVGVLLSSPLVFVCAGGGVDLGPRGIRIAELVLFIAGAILLGALIFRGTYVEHIYPWMYLAFPPLFWASMRFGLMGAALFPPVVVLSAVWSIGTGDGGILACHNYGACLIRFQFYACVMSVTSLVLGAVIATGRRTGRALRESESHKGAILASAPECIIALDRFGAVIEFNPAAEAMFGYTRGRALGLYLEDLVCTRTADADLDLFAGKGGGISPRWSGSRSREGTRTTPPFRPS